MFVSLVAPRIFTWFWEFHTGLIACVLVAIVVLARDRQSWWYRGKPYLGGIILLGLVLSPFFIERNVNLGIIFIVMDRLHYYPVLTVVALLAGFMVLRYRNTEPGYRRFNLAQAASILVLLSLSAALAQQVRFDERRQVDRKRNFYGSLTVERGVTLGTLQLRHGQILHGLQWRLHPKEPTIYYSRRSGIGLLMQNLPGRAKQPGQNFGMIGLGVGTLAAYALPGDTMRFYEVNPQVISYSLGPKPFFTFLNDSPADISIVRGDARLSLENELRKHQPQSFDVLVVDAFSSDAIPVHLLTQEAMEIYLQHLRGPDSIVAVHISNRSLDLSLVVSALAAKNHLAAVFLGKPKSMDLGESSDWILLSRSPEALQVAAFQGHVRPMPPADPAFLWSDDYSNIFRILKHR